MKKVYVLLVLSVLSWCYAETKIEQLWQLSINNSIDVKKAKDSYEISEIAYKGLDGIYSPSVSISAGSVIPHDYNWGNVADQFSSNITYTQPIPGGTSLSFSGNYTFNSVELNGERYVQQSPNFSVGIQQSLCPFWIQGTWKDPNHYINKKNKDYSSDQLIYAKKEIIQNVTQLYINFLVCKCKSQMYSNTIDLLQEKIKSYRVLQGNGKIDYSKINELENSKWSYQQDYISLYSNLEQYKQNINVLCGTDFSFDLDDLLPDEYLEYILELLDNTIDPMAQSYLDKIEMQNSQTILYRQSYAPTLSLSVSPSWKSNMTELDKRNESWTEKEKPDAWTGKIVLDLSPLFNGLVSNKIKQSNISLNDINNVYKNYMQQKEIIRAQYANILNLYSRQYEEFSVICEEQEVNRDLWKIQFDKGFLSELDYKSNLIQLENNRLNLQSIQLNIWLYQFMLKLL